MRQISCQIFKLALESYTGSTPQSQPTWQSFNRCSKQTAMMIIALSQ